MDKKIPRKTKRKSKINLEDIPSSNMKMKYYKKKREQKRIKTTIFKAHFFIKLFCVFVLLFLSSRLMIGGFWYLPQDILAKYPNKNVLVRGNKITPTNKIIDSLKKIPIQNKPIYMINTIPYEKEIEKLSPVKRAFIRRYLFPARFEVTIEEEIPAITISPNPNAPEIAAITLDGNIISKDYLPISDKKYKTYKILTYADYSKWSRQEIQSLQVLAQRIEDFSQEKLVYLDIRNKNDVYAQLTTIKIRIGELNSTLKTRVERLSSIMPQIENLKRQTDYVDIRWDNTTYLKKKSSAKPVIKPKDVDSKSTEIKQQTTQMPADKNKTPDAVIKTKTVEPNN